MQMLNLPRDLLQRFMSSSDHFSHRNHEEEENDEEEEIELSLGLSLNGRFGVDPRAKKLTRSSSIPDFINNLARKDTNESFSSLFPMACGSLVRTCSLPTETQTEEEWRKRKELQSLRRMEAKRKRSEKQKNLKAERHRNGGGFGEENCEEDKREEAGNGASWVNGGRGPCEGVAASLGSIGSQGSGSLGISELESQPTQERSPTSVQSAAETEQKPIIVPATILTRKSEKLGGVATENQPIEPAAAEKRVKEVVRNIFDDMPYVSTTGDGPNGKRIEGFLYRYRKGEEVRIVCVCHGSFLSPAEFVKHAGGGDVAHPLKHIVVSSSFLF
ncbi:ninja-family protein AFP3-like isoform X2 [Durio zibethinus]|uniref:Ninja-family protein n=1 Tax=Durio zibethinus TaxID=66656 RepID=A0A6P6BBV7_DURZI|nr:ninja-family protein AFP3-like isoform X2 [Durio zibethinus]